MTRYVCSKCKDEKPEDQFYHAKKRGEVRRYSQCKTCHKEAVSIRTKRHYAQNKKDYIARTHARRDEILGWVRDYKASTPCMDCGGTFHPEVMDFDHRDGTTKIGNVSTLVRRSGARVLRREIDKCDLICANCHRLRTVKRREQAREAQRLSTKPKHLGG